MSTLRQLVIETAERYGNVNVAVEEILDCLEIELASAISKVAVPTPKSEAQRLNDALKASGRGGFRPMTQSQREQLVQDLHDESYYSELLNVQRRLQGPFESAPTTQVMSRIDGTPLVEMTDFDPSQSTRIDSTEKPSHAAAADPIDSSDDTSSSPADSIESTDTTGFCASVGESWLWFPLPDEPTDEEELTLPAPPSLDGEDLRGRTAEILGGKLVALYDTRPDMSLEAGSTCVEVPNSQPYDAVTRPDLIDRYLKRAEEIGDSVSSRSTDPELLLIDAILSAMELSESWSVFNQRRYHLINKLHVASLSHAENTELERLQYLASMHAMTVAPLPFSTIASIEEYLRRRAR